MQIQTLIQLNKVLIGIISLLQTVRHYVRKNIYLYESACVCGCVFIQVCLFMFICDSMCVCVCVCVSVLGISAVFLSYLTISYNQQH